MRLQGWDMKDQVKQQTLHLLEDLAEIWGPVPSPTASRWFTVHPVMANHFAPLQVPPVCQSRLLCKFTDGFLPPSCRGSSPCEKALSSLSHLTFLVIL